MWGILLASFLARNGRDVLDSQLENQYYFPIRWRPSGNPISFWDVVKLFAQIHIFLNFLLSHFHFFLFFLLWDPDAMAFSGSRPWVLTLSCKSTLLSPTRHWINKQISPNRNICCQAHFAREKGIFIYQKCIYFKGAYHSLKFTRGKESQENQGHLHYNPPQCPKISRWTCRILRNRVCFAYLQEEKRKNVQGKEGTEV